MTESGALQELSIVIEEVTAYTAVETEGKLDRWASNVKLYAPLRSSSSV